MNSGMKRRVDELGRIVLPREIRKSYRIDTGAKLEIYVNDEGCIVLKKATELPDRKEYERVVTALASAIENDILITDREQVLASNRKRFIDKHLTDETYDIVRKQDSVLKNRAQGAIMVNVIEGEKTNYNSELFVPIVRDGDSIGAIIVLADENKTLTTENIKLCKAFALMLSLVD